MCLVDLLVILAKKTLPNLFLSDSNLIDMKFFNKLKWILGVLMVFFLIAITNLIDRSNFMQIRDSVVTIYEDRLVAKDLIFDMTRLVYEKELALVSADSAIVSRDNVQIDANLNQLMTFFDKTKLTQEEEGVLNELKLDLNQLQKIESNNSVEYDEKKRALDEKIQKVKNELYLLSKIQLKEGERQMAISKKAIDSIELFTHIEIYFLIFLAVIVQILVIYKPKE
ncbi:MAG: hypothetical protein ACJAWV_001255 [Flammeovirgaceae bacterium]|jgi:hypothetical protein